MMETYVDEFGAVIRKLTVPCTGEFTICLDPMGEWFISLDRVDQKNFISDRSGFIVNGQLMLSNGYEAFAVEEWMTDALMSSVAEMRLMLDEESVKVH